MIVKIFLLSILYEVINCCQSGTYQDPHSPQCITQCPDGYYKYNDKQTCVQSCPANPSLYADNQTRSCVPACSNYTYTFQPKRTCQYFCQAPYFADNTTRKCVLICPIGYYASNITRMCVTSCDAGTFGNDITRTCVESLNCPNATYGEQMTNLCVKKCPSFPMQLFGDNITKTCVWSCKQSYADNNTAMCIAKCYSPFYADNMTMSCVNNCSAGTFGENSTRSCVFTCPAPLFSDMSVNLCVSKCPSNPPMFGNNMTNSCVPFCSYQSYADNLTRLCVTTCPAGYYADNMTWTCVTVCPTGTFASKQLKSCVHGCPIGYYGDITTQTCVVKCPSPFYGNNMTNSCSQMCFYGSFADNTSRICLAQCPLKLYADNSTWSCVKTCSQDNITLINTYALDSTRSCVWTCPQQTSLYGDPISRKCANVCPTGYFKDNMIRVCRKQCMMPFYADKVSKSCVSNCTLPYYADENSRECVNPCPAYATIQMYGDNSTASCVYRCPPESFAENISKICLAKCPSKTALYGDMMTGSCVKTCPQMYFAQDVNRTCVMMCPWNSSLYGDNTTKKCVPLCPVGYFGEDMTKLCVKMCFMPYYGDNISRKCVMKCPNKYYADDQTHMCVLKCPAQSIQHIPGAFNITIPGSYGDPVTMICLIRCPPNMFGDNATRLCVNKCPSLPLTSAGYGDNMSQICLKACPEYLFAEDENRTCVNICPWNSTLFGDFISKKCVSLCPVGYFADEMTRQCLNICSWGYYGDNTTRKCVIKCPSLLFTENQTRMCVKKCPSDYGMSTMNMSIYPSFGDNSTMSCVMMCPMQSYADNTTRLCLAKCSSKPPMYGDRMMWQCLSNCNMGTYAEDQNRTCVWQCQFNSSNSSYFADNVTQKCVKNCSVGYFADNTTRMCVTMCNWGYGNQLTRQCVLQCPDKFFANQFNRTCVSKCPSDPMRMYGMTSNNNSAMNYTNITNVCVYNCQMPYFADNSTNLCVMKCPSKPSLYGDMMTFSCVEKCPMSTFSEDVNRSCVWTCPSQPSLYGDNITMKCVTKCPVGYFASNATRMCQESCSTAFQQFGDNLTRQCVAKCPLRTFADKISRLCVARCPGGTWSNSKTNECTSIDPPVCILEGYTRLWSNVSQWPEQRLPSKGEDVKINCNWTIEMDIDPAPMGQFIIDGEVTVPENRQLVNLTAEFIWIKRGKLAFGSWSNPFDKQAIIQINGNTYDPLTFISDSYKGRKNLVVTGKLQIFGAENFTDSTYLTFQAEKGSKLIYVNDAYGWKTGDEIVISTGSKNWYEAEQVTIEFINGSMISIYPALKYSHFGALNMNSSIYTNGLNVASKVILISRNIKIVSGPPNQNFGFGVYVHGYVDLNESRTNIGTVNLRGVQFANGGQSAAQLASLSFIDTKPFMASDWSSVNKCSFSGCNSECLRIRNSTSISVSSNVFYDAKRSHIRVSSTQSIRFTNNIMLHVSKGSFSKEDVAACFQNRQIQKQTGNSSNNATYNSTGYAKLQNNECYGSEDNGFILLYEPCNSSTNNYNNIAAGCQVGFSMVKSQQENSSCLKTSTHHAFNNEFGIVGNPQNISELKYQNLILVANKNGISLRFTSKEKNNTAYVSNSFISAILNSACWNCTPNATQCSENIGIRLLSITEKPSKTKTGIGAIQIQSGSSMDSKTFIQDTIFANFRLNYSNNSLGLNDCKDNFIFKAHEDAVDTIGSAFLYNSTLIEGDNNAIIKFKPFDSKHLGQGGCGDFECTSLQNYFIQDISGSMIAFNGKIIPNKQNFSQFINGCFLSKEMNGYICVNGSQQVSVLQMESIARDFDSRIVWPITLKQISNVSLVNKINVEKQWSFRNGLPEGKRKARATALFKLNTTYNLTFFDKAPADMIFQIQKKKAQSQYEYGWIKLILEYPIQNSIRIKARDVETNPIYLLDNRTEPEISKQKCGSYKYIYNFKYIEYILTTDCMIRLSFVNSVKASIKLNNDVNDFLASNGTQKFIDSVCTMLNISERNRVKVVGVYKGSTDIDFFVEDAQYLTVQQATSAPSAAESASSMTQMSNTLNEVITNGSLDTHLTNIGMGEVISVSTSVIMLDEKGVFQKSLSQQVQKDGMMMIIIIGAVAVPVIAIIIAVIYFKFIKRKNQVNSQNIQNGQSIVIMQGNKSMIDPNGKSYRYEIKGKIKGSKLEASGSSFMSLNSTTVGGSSNIMPQISQDQFDLEQIEAGQSKRQTPLRQ